MKNKNFLKLISSAASLLAITTSAQATLVVYEGFDYQLGTAIEGQGSGSGWDGSWTGSNGDVAGEPTVGNGLNFGTLASTGNAYARPARNNVAESSRTINATSQTALMMDNSTIYFSVLMDATNGNGFAKNTYGAFVIGDTAFNHLVNPGIIPPTIQANGNAVGVSFVGSSSASFDPVAIQGVTYENGVRVESATSLTVGDGTVMVVGKIDWAANGSDDTLTLYTVDATNMTLDATIATMAVDLDQSTFNVVATAQGQTEVFDEIRFGTELSDVGVVVPEPSSTALLGLGSIALLLRRRK